MHAGLKQEHPNGHLISNVNGELVAVCESQETARRIVACVNACAGFSDSELSEVADHGGFIEQTRYNAKVTAQREVEAALAESRANDRTGMHWLSSLKDAAGWDGDFPGLVEYLKVVFGRATPDVPLTEQDWAKLDGAEAFLTEERNRLGLDIDRALSGSVHDGHPLANRLRMVADAAKGRFDDLVNDFDMTTTTEAKP